MTETPVTSEMRAERLRAGLKRRYAREGRFKLYGLLAIGVAVAIMLVIVYVPFVAGFFGTGAISLLDWGFVLLAAVVFLALRELQRVLGLSRV